MQMRIEDVATPQADARDPARVPAVYNARRAQLADMQPNAAHLALAELERRWPTCPPVVTQTVAAARGRAATVELNLERSEGSHLFDRAVHGPATQIGPADAEELRARWT